jgi:hypothetical protein
MASCHAAAISAVRYQVLDILGFNGRWLCGFCSLKYGKYGGEPKEAPPPPARPGRRIPLVNALSAVTPAVVDIAREGLVIGAPTGRAEAAPQLIRYWTGWRGRTRT